jgi:DNA-directed RNA polymerase subunit RPC12/RpoP
MAKPAKNETVRQLEEQLEGDIPKAMGVAKQVFKAFGVDFDQLKNEIKADTSKQATQKTGAVIESDGRTITVKADACLTCSGKGKLGKKGHEIPCPICANRCATCGGTGKLGEEGHEIDCPKCRD